VSIVSSVILAQSVNADGSIHVVESHTDSTGKQHHVRYTASPSRDLNATLAANAVRVAAELAEIEAEALIG